MRLRSLVVSLSLALLVSVPVRALHNHLTKSQPADQADLAAAPTSIRLWFAEKPEVSFTSITLYRADQTKVAVGKAKASDDTLSVWFDVDEPLGAGTYTVAWRTAGRDGHAVRGRYDFTVTP